MSCEPKVDVTNVLVSSGEYVVLSNSAPYTNVLVFTGIVEYFTDNGNGTILKKDYRYSLDGDTFSEFQELTLASLVELGSFSTVYFQFRYILLSGGPVTLSKVELTFTPIPIDNSSYVPSLISDDSKVYAYPVIYKSNFTWEPYKMNRAIRLYKDLNLMVNNLFGHDVNYYRVLPHGRSRDVILMEYSLYEHDERQCMKVVVPNNEFPDNKLNMGPFGVDFELPFEIQIDKDYYQKIFGEGSGPQKRDVLFFPRTNRIYEVSSSYLFRDFMNEPLYFKVTLIKWLPKSNVEQNQSVDDMETFTASAASLFGEEIADEQIKVTNPQQYSISTTFEDPVRSFVNVEQTISDIKLLNYYTVIAEHFYKMDSMIALPLLTTSLPTVSLVKDDVYFARFDPTSSHPDEQYLYSMRKLTYKGRDTDDKCIFAYGPGTSQNQSLYTIPDIFGATSSFGLYTNDYTGSTADSAIASLTGDAYSYRTRIVEYKYENQFPATVDRSFSSWFRLTTNPTQIDNIVAFSFDMYSRQITITFDKPIQLLMGDTVTMKRTATSAFLIFGDVVRIISPKSVVIEVDQEIIDFTVVSFSNWETYTDLRGQKTFSRVFLNGWIDGKGLKIELYENRHFKITTNSTYKYASLPNTGTGLDQDVWYGLFINFSNIFKQLTVNLWKIQWNSITNIPATTDLSIVMNKTINITPADLSSCIKFYLEPSYMDLTNIRLFSRVAETDKQVLILNQNIVKDAQLALIIDNAIPQSRLPHIGYTR